MDKDEEDDEDKGLGLDARSNYNILNENKAVLLASYDLGDKCFGFTRNKQSLPMSVVCLVRTKPELTDSLKISGTLLLEK